MTPDDRALITAVLIIAAYVCGLLMGHGVWCS